MLLRRRRRLSAVMARDSGSTSVTGKKRRGGDVSDLQANSERFRHLVGGETKTHCRLCIERRLLQVRNDQLAVSSPQTTARKVTGRLHLQ